MITQERAERFAAEWIAAWNAHDLEHILAFYADDFEMSSPKIIRITGEPSGKLRGKAAVGAYWCWKRALEQRRNLHFRLIEVFAGVDSICISYESAPGHNAVEWFQLDDQFKVQKAAAHYGDVHPK